MNKTTEALKLALETADAIAKANWKTWEELATPEEFERWAKSRANHMASVLREALADHSGDANEMVAEPVKQGPVAWTNYNGAVNNRLKGAPVDAKAIRAEYEAPLKLAEEALASIAFEKPSPVTVESLADIAFKALRAIRAALGENNGRSNNTCNEKCDSNFYWDSDLVPVSTKALADHIPDATKMVAEHDDLDWITPEAVFEAKLNAHGILNPTTEPVKQDQVVWHHPECKGECIACLIERCVKDSYGTQGLDFMLRHINAAPVDAKAIREQALEEAAKFCEAKQSYNAMHANTEFAAGIRGLK